MELKDQVCNWKVAKRFKELGVSQKSQWYWSRWDTEPTEYSLDERIRDDEHSYSAFTVAELGEMLKGFVYYWDNGELTYLVGVESRADLEDEEFRAYVEESFDADTEADARAKLLIYLLENKKIKEGKK